MRCDNQAGANANGDAWVLWTWGDMTLDHGITRYNQQDGLNALYVKKRQDVNRDEFGVLRQQRAADQDGGAANTIILNAWSSATVNANGGRGGSGLQPL